MRMIPLAAALIATTIALGACRQADDDAHHHPTPAAADLPIGAIAAPEGAEVYFIEPADGAVLQSPVTVKFGLRGMGVAPAGVHVPNTGHHHLLIDVEDFATDRPLPADDRHRHFGGGQTETEIELPAGTHTLRLVLGDWKHQPHDPVVQSPAITITVE